VSAVLDMWPNYKEEKKAGYSDRGKYMGVVLATTMAAKDIAEIRKRWAEAYLLVHTLKMCHEVSHL
jgi:hypothetical protein